MVSQRIARLEEKLHALLDTPNALVDGGDSDDGWDDDFGDSSMAEASTSARKHTVFTDDLDARECFSRW